MKSVLRLCVPCALLVTLGGCASLSEEPPGGVSHSGIWQLNPELSDDVGLFLAETRPSRPGRPGSRGGGPGGGGAKTGGMGGGGPGVGGRGSGGGPGMGRGGGARGPSARPTGGAGGPGAALMAELRSSVLDIDQRALETRYEYENGAIVVYRWTEVEHGNRQTDAGWDGATFVVAVEAGKRLDIERRYTLTGDGQALTVVTTLNGKSMTQLYEFDRDMTESVYGAIPQR